MSTTNDPVTLLVSAPVTLLVNIPRDRQTKGVADIMHQGIRNFCQKMTGMAPKGHVEIATRHFQVTIPDVEGNYMKFRADGTALSLRQAEAQGPDVYVSSDGGATFDKAATFSNPDMAVRFAHAWMDGHI